MASPLVSALTQIAAAWEALTPPDRTTITYHEIDGPRQLEGIAGDRAFLFDLPRRSISLGQAGSDGSSLADWQCAAFLRLSSAGRSRRAQIDAVANEVNLLTRYLESVTTWPAGVVEVYDIESEAELDDDGDVEITIRWRLSCAETD